MPCKTLKEAYPEQKPFKTEVRTRKAPHPHTKKHALIWPHAHLLAAGYLIRADLRLFWDYLTLQNDWASSVDLSCHPSTVNSSRVCQVPQTDSCQFKSFNSSWRKSLAPLYFLCPQDSGPVWVGDVCGPWRSLMCSSSFSPNAPQGKQSQ